MAAAFAEIALPWLQPQPRGVPGSQLGPGLGAAELQAGLERLVAWEDVRAVVVFGSRARGDAQADSDLDLAVICAQPQLTPQQKQACYQRFRAALGGGVGLWGGSGGAGPGGCGLPGPVALARDGRCGPRGEGALCRRLKTPACC